MKTTMELCKEAGYPLMTFEGVTYVSPELERLVARVRADERSVERERVLKILDDQGTWAHVSDLIELVKGNT
jgi:hypothetical protein